MSPVATLETSWLSIEHAWKNIPGFYCTSKRDRSDIRHPGEFGLGIAQRVRVVIRLYRSISATSFNTCIMVRLAQIKHRCVVVNLGPSSCMLVATNMAGCGRACKRRHDG